MESKVLIDLEELLRLKQIEEEYLTLKNVNEQEQEQLSSDQLGHGLDQQDFLKRLKSLESIIDQVGKGCDNCEKKEDASVNINIKPNTDEELRKEDFVFHIQNLPSRYQRRAMLFFNFIRENSVDFKIFPNLEISINGKFYPKSNIEKLLRCLLDGRDGGKTLYFKQFKSFLNSKNFHLGRKKRLSQSPIKKDLVKPDLKESNSKWYCLMLPE